MKQATVIGLGQMGSTLAQLLLDSGYRVTVWNRTAAKADALVAQGAVLAPSALAAVSASPVVIVCVHDYAATHEILGSDEIAAAFEGKLLLQLTTGAVQEARDSDAWAREHGGAYLDGAIQTAPAHMGKPDTPILLSGAEATYRGHESLLRIFGGSLTYLGDDPGAANAMDMATLSYIYGTTIGFLHGARIAETEGFRVDQYGALVASIAPSFAGFLKYEGDVIQSGDFTVSQSPLKISVEATQRIAKAARDSGINDEFPSFAAGLFERAQQAGYGDEEIAALIKVLR
ncbi:MAG: NAD(P)-dependent oxidoreductase [Luteimonas sp.]|nr:NAD(P)-dependent oxidoreductase [Luteimonas sp.]